MGRKSPLDYIADGIKKSDMDLVSKGYELLTGIKISVDAIVEDVEVVAPKKRGRPKKAESKPKVSRSRAKKTTEKRVNYRNTKLSLILDKYDSPFSTGEVKVLGNNFQDDGVTAREPTTKKEAEAVSHIQSMLGVRQAPQKVKAVCKMCSKAEFVSPLQKLSKYYYCARCIANRR